MSGESIENITTSGNISFFRKVINPYISLTPDPWSRDLNTDFTIRNCLFRSVKLTENSNPDKYKYSGYDI